MAKYESLEHHKEDMIRQLVEMKKRINETIILIDNANNSKELILVLLSSPMMKNCLNDKKE